MPETHASPRPSHPGKVFLDEVLTPLGLTQRAAAERLRISYPRMNEIVNGKRRVTPETALRLARFSGTDPTWWLDLQQAVDLWDAVHSAEDAERIRAVEPAIEPGAWSRVRPAVARTESSRRERSGRFRAARVLPLGAESDDDPGGVSTAAERLAMVEELTRQSWGLALTAPIPTAPAGGASLPPDEAADEGRVEGP